jgi:hypothetical protein
MRWPHEVQLLKHRFPHAEHICSPLPAGQFGSGVMQCGQTSERIAIVGLAAIGTTRSAKYLALLIRRRTRCFIPSSASAP